MTKMIVGVLIALVLLGGGAFLLMNGKDDQNSTTQSQNNQSNSSATNDTTKTIDAATVSQHKSSGDCWTIISGKVYDITNYIPNHPGGDEILRACGNDATTLFTQRTTDSGEKVGSGTPHSSTAASQLQRYLIGTLAAKTN